MISITSHSLSPFILTFWLLGLPEGATLLSSCWRQQKLLLAIKLAPNKKPAVRNIAAKKIKCNYRRHFMKPSRRDFILKGQFHHGPLFFRQVVESSAT